jgi:L-ascorbate metabolism protein UlaG (beta-lactamase superfamily)
MFSKSTTMVMAAPFFLFASIPTAFMRPASTAAAAVLRPAAAVDSMTFIGHASVKIKTAQRQIIYIDPYQPGDYSDSADVVLITHQHGDHNNQSLIKKKKSCTVITNAEALQNGVYKAFTIGGTNIGAVPAYNANHAKASCVGYVVSFNGINLYHAGDTGFIAEMANLALKNITYALLPMDGIYNMTPEQAVTAAAAINAAYVIPIHTMPPPDTVDDAIVARFTAPNRLVVKNGETIALQPASSVKKSGTKPRGFRIEQNYPNPFNPSTRVAYFLDMPSRVTLSVYSISGVKVKTLEDACKPSGSHTALWDGTDANGTVVGAGVYVVELSAPSFRQGRRMMLVR